VQGELLERLRSEDRSARTLAVGGAVRDQWQRSGVRFVASDPMMEARYDAAQAELASCIRAVADEPAILNEGGAYPGCWLESTGTISAELLSRFLPEVAGSTLATFTRHQREDGLFPYKLTAAGPGFAQIQLVTPPARSIWTHYRLNGQDKDWLAAMYAGLARYDAWLAQYRDTRDSGGVEAFCAYDTGHDLSPRFWHVPDSPFGNDPARYDPANPLLPFIAPDLTAAVACSRRYLALMAEELGDDRAGDWRDLAAGSEAALFGQCWDEADGIFYDRDGQGRPVRIQSDVLLRVLACEIGDGAIFREALRRYLLNTRKFFAKYPLTSIALDDPRYDHGYDYNSWAGPTNLLTLVRAAHAFEHHGHHVELSWIIQPTLTALFRAERFAQTLHPFTGRVGYTESYSPAILCLIDFIERLCGILPRPDGTVWFTGLTPRSIEHRDVRHSTGYSRRIDRRDFELINTGEGFVVVRDGDLLVSGPPGIRVVADRGGEPVALIGMSTAPVEGRVRIEGEDIPFRIEANQRLDRRAGGWIKTCDPGLVPPSH
jgi:hypothetical protein